MISEISTAKGSGPCFFCDTCGKTIRDNLAAALFVRPEGAEVNEIFHVHKGVCHDTLESGLRVKFPDRAVVWDELAFHVLCLMHNSGITEEDMKNSDISAM